MKLDLLLLCCFVLKVQAISECQLDETRIPIKSWRKPLDVEFLPRYGPGVLFSPFPSESPTDQPLCIPSTEVEMMVDFGDQTPSGSIVSILEQSLDATSVVYQVYQRFKNTAIDYIGTEYKRADGLIICYQEESVEAGPLKQNITAACDDGYAVVKVYVLDETFFDVVGFQDAGSLSSNISSSTPATSSEEIVRTRGVVRKLAMDGCAIDENALVASFRLPCSSVCDVVPLSADVASTTVPSPISEPTNGPSNSPSVNPSTPPSSEPSGGSTDSPSFPPSSSPSSEPTGGPTNSPTDRPSFSPSTRPSSEPSPSPSYSPSSIPSISLSEEPSVSPSQGPTGTPTQEPTICIPQTEAIAESDFGPYTPHDDIVQILQQSSNGKTVVFQVHQEFKLLGLGMIAAEYESADGLVCYSEENVISGPLKSYQTAICVDGIATVSILAKDDCFLPVEFAPPEELPDSALESEGLDTNKGDCPLPQLNNKTKGSGDVSPIEILTYGDTEVLFKVSQVWKQNAPLSSLWVRHHSNNVTVACPSSENIEPDYANTYTATCFGGFADIDLYVEDDTFVTTSMELPSTCNGHSGLDGAKMYGYSYKVPCSCEAINSARRLAQTYGACFVDGATVKATYKIPCSPGCGAVPLNLGLPTQSPTSEPTSQPTRKPTPQPTIPPPTAAPTSRPTVKSPWAKGECPYLTLDFNGTTNGQYITDTFTNEFGVTIRAVGSGTDAYTPDGAARIFDTSDPLGDTSLGSPNQKCVNAGPGVGWRGEPGSTVRNCKPLGMALIIQEGRSNAQTKPYPDDYSNGGNITFSFVRPIYLKRVVVLDTNSPILKMTLADGIIITIQGTNTENNGVEEIIVDLDRVVELEVQIARSGAIAQVDYIPCDKEIAGASELPDCDSPMANLDFNDQSILQPGDYITNQLYDKYGVKVKAMSYVNWGGYTPDSAARVYDSSNGGSDYMNTPNKNCPDGGPGIGIGGGPDSMYSNCEPLGNVLIVQRSKQNNPQPNDRGAIFKFTFDTPTYINDIGLLNIVDGNMVQVWVTRYDGVRIPFKATVTDQNGMYLLEILTANVLELKVMYTGESAITHINYIPCAVGEALDWVPTDVDALLWEDYESPWNVGQECPYVSLDFNKNAENGQYITDDFVQDYGVMISAEGNMGGYTPDGAARIFDSSNPKGDINLGTPNRSCGGPGDGSTGEQGAEFENCKALGNVLVIQESKQSDMSVPNDYDFGGTVTFKFIVPVHLKQVKMIDTKFPIFKMTVSDGSIVQREGRNSQSGGVENVVIDLEGVKKLEVVIASAGAIAQLDYIPCSIEEATALIEFPECERLQLNFNDESLEPADYITDQLKDKYGVVIGAEPRWSGGYTPDGAARIFDTSNPHSGDRELGSPNQACPGGGRGVGLEGAPGSPFASCEKLGNVLIVQESRRDTPDSSNSGGFIIFKFDKPSFVEYLTFLNGQAMAEIWVTLYNGDEIPFRTDTVGANALHWKDILLPDVIEVRIEMLGKMGVVDMKYGPCPSVVARGWRRVTAAPTPAPGGIYPTPWKVGECPYVSLDFEGLAEGTYVRDEFAEKYGVVISAQAYRGGMTPGGKARIIDTEKATWKNSLGTPNRGCGGVGNGSSGDKGRRFENCEPLKNALVIQGFTGDPKRVFDNRYGGWIKFSFVVPIFLKRVITINTRWPRYKMTLEDGTLVKMEGDNVATNGVDHMAIDVDKVLHLEVFIDGEGAIAQLDFVPCGEHEYEFMMKCPDNCGMAKLDFDAPNINRGDYITDQFKAEYGVTINAYNSESNAYVPDFAARIFGTSQPWENSRGNRDLGSPNEGCPSGGPGVGAGGAPSSKYANCEAIGNALIIQGGNNAVPISNSNGGQIVFRFDKPAYIGTMSIMDIDDNEKVIIWAHIYNDVRVPIRTEITGENGVYTAVINTLNVVKLVVQMKETAAIAELNYSLCPVGDAVNWKPKAGMMG